MIILTLEFIVISGLSYLLTVGAGVGVFKLTKVK